MALIFIILAIIFAVLAINLFSSANKHESRYNNTSKATNKKGPKGDCPWRTDAAA